MAKTQNPLGSNSAHGAVGNLLVFQGTVAREHVIPRDPKTAAQLAVRSDFQGVNKILFFAGGFVRAVFYKLFGARWYALLFGWIRGDWENHFTNALNEYDDFSEVNRAAWDNASPFMPGMVGAGRIFYAVIRVCYERIVFTTTSLWGAIDFLEGDAVAAAEWWMRDESVAFEAGIYDDNDSRFEYSEHWSSQNYLEASYGAQHEAEAPNEALLKFYFLGSFLRIYYLRKWQGATVKITIDGVDEILNQDGTNVTLRRSWVSPVLDYGIHEVTILQLGLDFVNFDGIEVQ